MKKVVAVGVFLALVFCLFTSVPVRAQVTGATLSGTVTDASGAVVGGAQISLRNLATALIREATTDSSGSYTLPNLRPGDSEARVTTQGFSTLLQPTLTPTIERT